tara:strand:- start:3778 stop:4398 length:621 start_codon:yes stop_codon:yes gene_type:complete
LEPIDTYLLYCGLRTHFNNNDYDFIKYNGKSRVSRDSYYKRKDKFFFARIASRYKNYETIKEFFIANFVESSSSGSLSLLRQNYVSEFTDETYQKWKNKKDNFYDIFIEELSPLIENKKYMVEPLFAVTKNNHPKLFKEYLGNRISIETLIILDDLVGFSKKWDKELSDDVFWPDLKMFMIKYKKFMSIDKNKYKKKILKLIEYEK